MFMPCLETEVGVNLINVVNCVGLPFGGQTAGNLCTRPAHILAMGKWAGHIYKTSFCFTRRTASAPASFSVSLSAASRAAAEPFVVRILPSRITLPERGRG